MSVPIYTIKRRNDGLVNLYNGPHKVASCLKEQEALTIIHMSNCHVRMVKALKMAKVTLYEADMSNCHVRMVKALKLDKATLYEANEDYNDPNFADRRIAGPHVTQAYHAVREALLQVTHEDTKERTKKAKKLNRPS